MQDFEKLGIFYLGKPYDLETKQHRDGWLLYDSKDLVTHAVCVGMTGSGKTGLCIGLLEEAALDGIPAIAIDPKGDLSNLLLTFPDLRPSDFLPWVNVTDAAARGVSPEALAEQQAAIWKKGLSDWGQDGSRIRRLKDAADFAVYTPGSSAGAPVSVLRTLAAPPAAVLDDPEAFKEHVVATATSLLTLAGVDSDPIKSREHILVSTLLVTSWKAGRPLDLALLIQAIQSPPVSRIGVLDLESFYPSKERFALAMAINNLLASPGFGAWLEGDPLDIGRMLHSGNGKPRVSIFSIAHLGDAERMFFVSFLLNSIVGWMRAQSGTTSLRAVLYMDEIAGYFPPVANPPSKPPFMTLIKQARAYGLGVVVATQNPVDLDYKGLSNAGTWFIGRLQTERDKARMLDGLEGVSAGAGSEFDRGRIEKILSSLGNRVFLMNNVHESGPEVFQTRWTMSYLRGPLTREQIRSLSAENAASRPAIPAGGPGSTGSAGSTGSEDARASAARERSAQDGSRRAEGGGHRPVLPPSVPQFLLPPHGRSDAVVAYRPVLLGSAQVRFVDKASGIDETQSDRFVTNVTDEAVPVSWDDARAAEFDESELARAPGESEVVPARFEPLPAAAAKAANYAGWSKDFAAWLARTRAQEFLRSPATRTVSRPGESERDFRIRLQQQAREDMDAVKEKIQKSYAARAASLTERLRRAEQAVERESEQSRQQKMQTAISFGATVLGSLLGRRKIGVGTLGRATTAARGVGRAMKEAQDVGRAQDSVEALKAQLAQLDTELQDELHAEADRRNPLTETLETLTVRPARKDITVRLVALVWVPS